jgi:hypothetical protein
MTQASFAERLEETAELLNCALDAIEQGGEQVDLDDLVGLLGYQLLACMRLVERDPGLEAAASDLFAAATALVRENRNGFRPSPRIQRLLREARTRFKSRLEAARPSEHGTRIVWRHHELVNAA